MFNAVKIQKKNCDLRSGLFSNIFSLHFKEKNCFINKFMYFIIFFFSLVLWLMCYVFIYIRIVSNLICLCVFKTTIQRSMRTYYYNVVGVYNIFANNQYLVTFALLQGARGEFTATSNGNKHNGNNQKTSSKKE